jgi:hypothetical protein
MWERFLVLRASVIRAGILLISGIAATGAIRPQQPARTATAARTSSTEKRADARGDFVGHGICRQCHQAIADTYVHTNHHLTSQLPSKKSVAGKFTGGENILKTRDPDLHFRMDAKANDFYETAIFWQPPNHKARSERIDFVIGSGKEAKRICPGEAINSFMPTPLWTFTAIR